MTFVLKFIFARGTHVDFVIYKYKIAGIYVGMHDSAHNNKAEYFK